MLTGNFPTKVDDKGRIKIPTAFRQLIEKEYGTELYVTSLSGDNVLIYPREVWMELMRRIARLPSMEPVRIKFLSRTNYFGQMTAMDKQGRVLIHTLLRESAQMDGEVAVLGSVKHLEVWNKKRYEEHIKAHPLTEKDMTRLAELNI
ncbi:division/cell wall cluster transcriptional repressor MraZ [bacterium (candidate division B38) B3_B38]|nr:MAG: division/cell wall cluster transcriptional repressor MraZ [bacterium (candidate division B38) B3_B38]